MRRLYAFTAFAVLFAVACTVSALAGLHPPASLVPLPDGWPVQAVALSCEAVYSLDGATICVARSHVAGALDPVPVPAEWWTAPGLTLLMED